MYAGVSESWSQIVEMADPKKIGTFGTVEVRVVEVRDVKVSYCTVKCEITQRQTAVKKKSELNAKFDEDFSLFVSQSSQHKHSCLHCDSLSCFIAQTCEP